MNSIAAAADQSEIAATLSGDLVLDALPVASYVCDRNGVILRYNPRASEIWGRKPAIDRTPERFCGSYRLYRSDGVALSHAESPMAETLRSGMALREQSVGIERPDGERSDVLIDVNPLRDNGGYLIGAVSCFRTVSARPPLPPSRQEFEDFFENGAVALHCVGSGGQVVRANQAELELLGYTREEYIGQHISDFHADPPVIDDILMRLSRGETLERYPARLLTKSGDIRHVLISSNVFYRDGQFVHTRCFTIDVTERHLAEVALQQSESRWRELLAALPAAVYTTDAQGAITFYNEAAASLWGMRPELGTSHWCGSWRLLDPDGTPLPHERCPMAIALKEGRAVRNIEAMAERPDGTRVTFMPYPTPLRDVENNMAGAVNMLIDLTHLKEAHRRQQLLINELNHRVKNTLAIVQSIGLQTFRGKVDDELRQQFDNRLIALAQAHDMLTQENWRGADLHGLISKSIEFACDVQDRAIIDGPSLLLPRRTVVPMAMAIHELCTNASKYGALTHPQGRIHIGWHLLAGDRAQLRWEESGGPAVKPPNYRGFGTRLIERGLAHELHGDVSLEFDPGGVRCTIAFPLTEAAQLEVPE